MSENKLHLEKSLYLRQHAENPIHWQTYGEEALVKAQSLNKLIFLSIGYSSCHWCHVMAHESFENVEIANYLNEHFVSIKIDREEYPDLDHYYQAASSLMTGRGGWPLTIFLTPNGKPFFAGTYFPPEAKKGLPGFMEVLNQITELYKKDPKAVEEGAQNLTEELKKPIALEKKVEFKGHFPPPSAILNALKGYSDPKNGGYGKAPKFPHLAFYEWASEQILEGMIPKEQGQHIVESVERMLMGGLYDHAKGGMHRYSTDDKFLVPHFEKMLYDQAGLLKLLPKITQFYPAPLLFDSILQTIDYLRTEMVAEEGFFFSAQDADSEGTEGLYFTFSKEEFEASFEEATEDLKKKIPYYLEVFNITDKGNFDHGLNVLSLNPGFKNEYYSQDGWQEIRDIRRRLLDQRKMRMPPATDRKGICGWNFMMISSLCDVAQYCSIDIMRNEALSLIKQTIEGCMTQFLAKDKDGRHVLKHTNTLEKQSLYLEDYAFFAEANLRLYEITGNETFKTNCMDTVEFVLNNMYKDKNFYLTSLTQSTTGIDNLVAPQFDQSYRSASMTMISLLSRLSVFRPEYSPEDMLGEKYHEMIQLALTNPLGHGEGLRAFTYPLQIFRKIEVPVTWLENQDFLQMRSHFFSRFVMEYHSRDDESYQICTKSSCEVQGKGISEFQKIFQQKEAPDA